jgi:hypothetical protein
VLQLFLGFFQVFSDGFDPFNAMTTVRQNGFYEAAYSLYLMCQGQFGEAVDEGEERFLFTGDLQFNHWLLFWGLAEVVNRQNRDNNFISVWRKRRRNFPLVNRVAVLARGSYHPGKLCRVPDIGTTSK